MQSVIEIMVRSTEVDYLGHVNNAKFLEYMEWGREDWYKQTGYSFDELGKRGIGTAVVNININYYGECFRGDELIIKTYPGETGNTSFVLYHEIFKKETIEKVSDARVTTVTMDLETRKSIPVPSYLGGHFS